MTSPTSAATDRRLRAAARRGARGRGGFTIVELLVVIGIMILLAAILLPMVMKAYGKAVSVKMAADLAAIGTALEAYRQDFNAYPPVREDPDPIQHEATRPNPPTGAQILCQALLAPAGAADPMPAADRRQKQDGEDGPGFRVRRLPGPNGTLGDADDQTGKLYPPYLDPAQFKVGVPGTEPLDTNPGNVLLFCILDRNDQPVLYFPASRVKPNVRVPIAGVPSYVAASETSLFDVTDNQTATQKVIAPGDDTLALRKMRLLLGDKNGNGLIEGDEVAVSVPFILWSAGADDIFGPRGDEAVDRGTLNWDDVEKSDDVTNFR